MSSLTCNLSSIRTHQEHQQHGLRERSAAVGCMSPRTPHHLSVRVKASAEAVAATPSTPSPFRDRAAAAPVEPPSPSWTGYLPNCRGAAVVSKPGKVNGRQKPNNQDSFLTHSVQPLPWSSASVIGVFDGHGKVGHVASSTVKQAMADVVEECTRSALAVAAAAVPEEPPSPGRSPSAWAASNLGAASAMSTPTMGAAALDLTHESAQWCLKETFSRAADTMRSASADFMNSGSTAVVCMLLQDSVVAAWAGDSRAVMGIADSSSDSGYTSMDLTRDHKPNNLGEMARIVAAGGKVARVHKDRTGNPTGPFRVFLPVGVSPGLSVARAFGDILLSTVGVVPTPDITVFQLNQNHSQEADSLPALAPTSAAPAASSSPSHVLIVASDGLWQYIDSQGAVDIAAAAGSPEAAAQALVDAAAAQWDAVYGGKHCDDITVAVAFL